jgi:predicted flavoprotein YhiN
MQRHARYFEPNELVKFLRGEKKDYADLFISLFSATIGWFENGVELKIETDGRMFPVSIL